MNIPLKLNTVRKLKDDPFGFIIDTLVKIVLNLIIPIPLAGELISEFRGPVLGCFAMVFVLGISLIVIIGMAILSPFFFGETILQKLNSLTASSSITEDTSFIQTDSPIQIPFGGQGFEYASITAGFMDPNYYLKFGEIHTGIDLVPNDNYYKNSESYKKYHKVIVYATMTGTAGYFIDQNGGLTVEDTNPEGTIKVLEIHMKEVFVKTGDSLKAGTPIGIMGMTGHATGEHVHFEIQVKDGDTWIPVNPMTYIK